MSIIDRPHQRQLLEFIEASKEVANRIGPYATSPEEEQALARFWLALHRPAIAAISSLEQTHLPFNEAELIAEKSDGEYCPNGGEE